MIRNTKVWGMMGIAALAFAVGRLWVPADSSVASAQEVDQMPPEMQAYVEAMTPGAHHKQLEPLIGKWEGQFKMWMDPAAPPQEMPGTIERDWVLEGHYMRETVESQSEMGTFHGLGYMGFNNVEGQYEFVWMENMSTAIMWATGSFDPKTKVLSTRGTRRDPVTGHTIFSRAELDLSSPDRHVYHGYETGADGKERKTFEGVVTRVK